MTEDDLMLLRSKEGKEPVKICFTDGEEAVVKVLSVSETERDVIYDLVSSNFANKYKDTEGCFLANWDDIKYVSEVA